MTITVVTFRAFDKEHMMPFVKDETMEQIHNVLNELCATYVPLHIIKADDAEPISVNRLNNLKKVDHV